MRILRLVAPDEFSLEFHPYVTVVTGLEDHQRDAVIAAFRDAVAGRQAALTGLLEVHGVVLDLDERSLGLLDLADVSVDVVVDAGDLPGAASSGAGRRLRAAERRLESLEEPHRRHRRALEEAEAAAAAAHEALQRCRAELDAADRAEAADPEVQRLEAEVAAAEAELEALAAPASRAAGELEQAERSLAATRTDEAAGRIEELRSRRADLDARHRRLLDELDPDAAAGFEQALAHLHQVEAEAARLQEETAPEAVVEPDGPDEAEPEPGSDEPAEETAVADPAAAAARADEIRGALALHDSFEPDALRAALDAIRLSPALGELVPSPEALTLAERLGALEHHLAGLRTTDDEPTRPDDIEAVAARLDQVRGQLVELELTSVPSSLEADIDELERAHAEVTEARERLDGRFGRARAEERLEQAIAAEEAALERLGIRSYTDFMTGGRAAVYQRAESDELRELRAREREMEAELRLLQSRAEGAKELLAAEREHDELCDQARALLGDRSIADDELVRALRDLRVPMDRSSPLDDLLDALESVGLRARSLDVSAEDVEAMAEDWLEEYHRAEDRRAALESELAALESTPAGAEDAGSPADAGRDAESPGPVALPMSGPVEEPAPVAAAPPHDGDVEAARDAVRSAKERMVAHETAARELREVEEELETLDGEQHEVEELARRIEAASVVVEEARARLGAIERDRAAAEARVVEGRATLEQRRATPTGDDRTLAAVEDAELRVMEADDAVRRGRADLDAATGPYEAALEEVAALRHEVSEQADEAAPVEEIEWYLLARLAAQRQVSFAGSVPLVLDRALDAVGGDGLVHLLERLERMAGAVQVVHLTDDEDIVRWAEASGDDRVGVVSPGAAVTAG